MCGGLESAEGACCESEEPTRGCLYFFPLVAKSFVACLEPSKVAGGGGGGLWLGCCVRPLMGAEKLQQLSLAERRTHSYTSCSWFAHWKAMGGFSFSFFPFSIIPPVFFFCFPSDVCLILPLSIYVQCDAMRFVLLYSTIQYYAFNWLAKVLN